MSSIKISQLTEKTTMDGSEELLINDSGTSKKMTTQPILDAQTAAETAQTAAETAQTNAETAETNAASSASAASTSASNASTSASNAASSESAAASSATAAQAAEDAALAALDNFDDRYLGVKTSDPTVDNDGDALVAGALYYNSTDDVMKVYEGSSWVAAYASLSGTLVASNNLSDLTNATAARTNLGLGTAATTASTDYATAAQGTTADSALQNLSEDTTPQLGGDLDTNGNDINFGDSDALRFGDGLDLRIYHDGSNSVIRDAGTGDLLIQADNLRLGNAAGTEQYILADSNGAVQVRYDGSTKLATTSTGIDVTGTVTADGLTVDGELSISKDSGYNQLHLGGDRLDTARAGRIIKNWDSPYDMRIRSSSSISDTPLYFETSSANTRMAIAGNGDISFYEDTGTTPKFFWDASAERLGIGTSSPTSELHIVDATANAVVRLESSSTGSGSIIFDDQSGTNRGTVKYDHSDDSMSFLTNGLNEHMRIDFNGNVGIGTSSPVNNSNRTTLALENVWGGQLDIMVGSTVHASFGTDNFSTGQSCRIQSQDGIVFKPSGSERMRIDSSGHLLVGTSSTFTNSTIQVKQGNLSYAVLDTWHSASSGTRYHLQFADGSSATIRGSITTNGSSTSYNTSSDYRLKENVVDMTGAIDRVKALQPKRFNWIADEDDTTVDGFLAHEVSDVIPEAISGEKDGMRDEEYQVTPALGEIYTPAIEEITDEDGNITQEAVAEAILSTDVEQPETLEEGQQWRETTPAEMGTRTVPDYQGIDQSKLVPLLTGALQEAIAKIEALETRIETLENA